MKNIVCRAAIGTSSLLLVLLLVGIGAAAQSQGSQPKKAPATATCACCQTMMPGGELSNLVDRIGKSSAALAKETDSTALKKELAENNTLVKSFQAKFQEHVQMMQTMMAGGGCCGAGCTAGNAPTSPGQRM